MTGTEKALVAVVALAGGYFAYDRFIKRPATPTGTAPATPAQSPTASTTGGSSFLDAIAGVGNSIKGALDGGQKLWETLYGSGSSGRTDPLAGLKGK